ncbi:uncharacterized protein B0H64DRAFT_385206 [Chaetomium fimeti]|uniref:Secreted protein n=1 Tax=Chaetomium fimeti TaxID=1854472 RepID=A0AAE0HKZ1_9PEZI|nr:hypothetical protein B0H64DRAFT_385206 [Chaetomium fimeti]
MVAPCRARGILGFYGLMAAAASALAGTCDSGRSHWRLHRGPEELRVSWHALARLVTEWCVRSPVHRDRPHLLCEGPRRQLSSFLTCCMQRRWENP